MPIGGREMLFPKRGVEIIDAFLSARQYQDLANGSEFDRRLLTRLVAEQMAFELSPGWGLKAQSQDHPQSKDSLAFTLTTEDNSSFLVWDWQNGNTRERHITDQTPGVEITGQLFIPVEPRDVLGRRTRENPPDLADELATLVQHLEEKCRPELGDILTLLQKIAQDEASIIRVLESLLSSHIQQELTLDSLVLEGRIKLPFGSVPVVLSKKRWT